MAKYDSKYHPQIVKFMCRAGMIDTEIQKELGIAKQTFYTWRKKYPEFDEACRTSKNFVDSLVEDSLLKNALGYEAEEEKVITQIDAETGEEKLFKREIIRKHIKGDTTAQIFWLKNRQKDRWSDVKKLDVNANVEYDSMTQEELEEEIRKLEGK